MKTFTLPTTKFLIVALVLMSSLAVGQGGIPARKAIAVAIYPAADISKVWMNVEKTTDERWLRVEMRNSNGLVLYFGVVAKKTKAYRQKFDLSQLKDELYTFRISDGQERTELSFRLSIPGVEEALPQRMITMNK